VASDKEPKVPIELIGEFSTNKLVNDVFYNCKHKGYGLEKTLVECILELCKERRRLSYELLESYNRKPVTFKMPE
jgi:hypothetical protein